MKKLTIFIVVFILAISNIANEKHAPTATYEEEEEARQEWIAISDSIFPDIPEEGSRLSRSEKAQICLNFRDKHPNTTLAGYLSRKAAFLYLEEGEFEMAIECCDWIFDHYSQMEDEIVSAYTNGFPPEPARDSEEYEDYRIFTLQVGHYMIAVGYRTAALFRLGRYNEVKEIYTNLKEEDIFLDRYNIAILNDEEFDLVEKYTWSNYHKDVWRYDFALSGYYRFDTYYEEFYSTMLYLIDYKLREKKK